MSGNALEKENRIIIFDTTLRDGEQASGFHMFPDEKIQIAKQLAKLGVDVIEAGFAASSSGDFQAIYDIAKEVGTKDGPIICSLARAVEGDIDAAARALEPAVKKRIHTFIATSDIHITEKLKKTREWVLEQTISAVKKARSYVEDVEFSCEDFGRSDLDYVVEVVSGAIRAGAGTINLPDTVGYLTPGEEYQKIKYVIDKIRERNLDAIFSVHNHNDLGLASANSIAAINAGARQIECTINGIGERAGNTALEEIVAILNTRGIGKSNVKNELIGETSRLVSEITGVYPQPNKAVVGENAFSHEAGIHLHGVQNNALTYEIMKPEDYGMKSKRTLGPRSGRNALIKRYGELGIKLNEQEIEDAYNNFINIADKKKLIDDADVISAIKNEKISDFYSLVSYYPVMEKDAMGMTIKIKVGSEIKTEYAEGNGQVDAAINAIKKIISVNYGLVDFKSESEGNGSDAIGFTKIIVSKNGWKVMGRDESTDIVRSAINAYIDGCNRIRYLDEYFSK